MITKTKDGRRKVYRNRWFEFTTGWHGIKFEYALGGYFDPHPMLSFSLGWGILFLHLPFKSKYDECEPPRYGFYYHESRLWFQWRRKSKSLPMPWEMVYIRYSRLLADGKMWETEYSGKPRQLWNEEAFPAGHFWVRRYYPYNYQLRSGAVQDLTATVMIEEREWRPRWLRWTRLFARVRRVIDVYFDDEAGEGAGSWKGGVNRTGHEMKPGETWEQTLLRMMIERKF